MPLFFFSTTEDGKAKQVLSGGLVPGGSGEDIRKVYGGLNVVEIFCTHV
jgi:hypothetical protein